MTRDVGRSFYLVYTSTTTIPFTQADLDRLLARARTANAERRVTGALLYRAGHFLQVIEGDEVVVRDLYRSICDDPRHQDVTYLTHGQTDHRQFDRWSMAFGHVEPGPQGFAHDFNLFFDHAGTEPGPTVPRHEVARRLLAAFRVTLD